MPESLAAKPMDLETKYSIWKAYGQKCVYSGYLIDNFDELEIDHIIPISEKKESIQKKINNYNLDPEFDIIRSIENLVPCLIRFNRLKWKRPFDESTERFFLNIAKSKKISVESNRNKFRIKQRNLEEELFKKSLETSIDFYTERAKFEKRKTITNREDLLRTNHYWNSDNQVAINCFLPSKYDETGSCVIEFKNSETMVSLRHSEILKLINDRQTSNLKELIFRGETFNGTKSFIIIGTNAIHLDNQIFIELLSLLNDLLDEYEKNYKDFENFIESENFERKGLSDFYVLAKMSQLDWNKLMNHSKKYDLGNGLTEDYCFNYNPNLVIAVDRNYNNIKFWLAPGDIVYKTINNFIKGASELELLWRIPSSEERRRIISGHVWTAKRTYEWAIKIVKIDHRPMGPRKLWFLKQDS